MDEVIEVIGLAGSCLIGLSFIPQTYKTIKENETKDISVGFMGLSLLSASMMVTYGVYYEILPMIISNGSVVVNCIIISTYMCKKSDEMSS